ncbi:uncharacterized protein [Antedon mediterranea]|uniref:uncharacterized protein n=1 Tax=Antedon mediterranea TaxID=105859 RepID=UPI003AF9B49E
MEEKKLKRRTSKSRFTRQKKHLDNLVDHDESVEEIQTEFGKLELAFHGLQDRHDEYCEMIKDEEAYNKEEEYIQACMDEFLAIKAKYKMALKKNPPQLPLPVQVHGLSNQSPPASINSASLSDPVSEVIESLNSSSTVQTRQIKLKPRVEKPKLPVFSGDVREYWTFRDDFKHMIEPVYEPRDAVSILRTSLTGKPLELLKGIGTDYVACWKYLDLYYGDPRIISDAVTQDI